MSGMLDIWSMLSIGTGDDHPMDSMEVAGLMLSATMMCYWNDCLLEWRKIIKVSSTDLSSRRIAWRCLSNGKDDRSGNVFWKLTYWFIFCLWRIFSSVSSRLNERTPLVSPRWDDVWTEKKKSNTYLCWVQVVLWSDCDFCFSVVSLEYPEGDFHAEQSRVGAVVDSAEIFRVVLRQTSYPSRRCHLTKDDHPEWNGLAGSSHNAAYLSKSIVLNSIEAAMVFDDSSHWYSPRPSRTVHWN